MTKKFVLNETSYFGMGAREVLAEEIKARGFKKTNNARFLCVTYSFFGISRDSQPYCCAFCTKKRRSKCLDSRLP